MFFHRDLTSLDPRLRAEALDVVLTRYRTHEQRLVDLTTSMTARLAEVEQRIRTTRYTARDTDLRADLQEALDQLGRGPFPTEGTLPEVSPFVGRPGLRKTRAEIARLSAELADAVLLRDHGHEVARYRLRPGFSNRWLRGPNGEERRLQAGDIVSITLAGYRSDPDPFEPVLEEVPTGTSSNVEVEAEATSPETAPDNGYAVSAAGVE